MPEGRMPGGFPARVSGFPRAAAAGRGSRLSWDRQSPATPGRRQGAGGGARLGQHVLLLSHHGQGPGPAEAKLLPNHPTNLPSRCQVPDSVRIVA